MFSLVSSYSYTANTLPDIENEDFIKDCVWIHNKLRSEVYPTASDMLYMTWDPELSRISKAWAKNCKFGHNPRLGPPHKLHPNFTSLGENIWTGSLSLFSVSSAIINWYKEIQYYDFRTRRCNKVCGHYTQTWDPELSRISKAWAKNCKFGHNPRLGPPHKLHPNFTSLGENIWTGSLSLFSVSSAIINWYKEIQYYDFRTRRCNKVCGHYTQVVWAQSYKVGCAVQFCPRVDGFESLSNGAHFVCNYGPAGNYPTWPYKKGSTCSACHNKDTCLDNLCEDIFFLSQVTTLLGIQAGPYIHGTDIHLSFSLLGL
ncbi:Glioma pathogenesis-related protein 1 [Tupaia chinensis]|uniref:Glioma pathogenesis-related protein 1 n=1 Tax=Tupaia chinensis TaxID=246437 RepID=L9L6K5_TUPCH|nr:Glioma pathogenesis-related protein 1 [Tupaia chinensis]